MQNFQNGLKLFQEFLNVVNSLKKSPVICSSIKSPSSNSIHTYYSNQPRYIFLKSNLLLLFMKRVELERAIQEQAERIFKSKLIPK
jgi:hypothetical protein